jgi:ApaG protein
MSPLHDFSMYRKTTHDITVTVQPLYLEEQSDPDVSQYVWAYHVNIENNSRQPVKLQHRYWHITDGHGRVLEVSGPGVVGEQPLIPPGGSFEYTSGTPLPTSSGIMVGRYGMVNGEGEQFDVDIPAFSLDSPFTQASIH